MKYTKNFKGNLFEVECKVSPDFLSDEYKMDFLTRRMKRAVWRAIFDYQVGGATSWGYFKFIYKHHLWNGKTDEN